MTNNGNNINTNYGSVKQKNTIITNAIPQIINQLPDSIILFLQNQEMILTKLEVLLKKPNGTIQQHFLQNIQVIV